VPNTEPPYRLFVEVQTQKQPWELEATVPSVDTSRPEIRDFIDQNKRSWIGVRPDGQGGLLLRAVASEAACSERLSTLLALAHQIRAEMRRLLEADQSATVGA